MCNCGVPFNTTPIYKKAPKNENCGYTIEMVLAWKDILFCIRDNDLLEQANLTLPKMNSYMGILLSAINSNSACFFQEKMDEIKPYILNIINLNLCPTI